MDKQNAAEENDDRRCWRRVSPAVVELIDIDALRKGLSATVK